jgi:hypothetical protein
MMMRVLSATLAVDGDMPINWRKDVAEDMIRDVECLQMVLVWLESGEFAVLNGSLASSLYSCLDKYSSLNSSRKHLRVCRPMQLDMAGYRGGVRLSMTESRTPSKRPRTHPNQLHLLM